VLSVEEVLRGIYEAINTGDLELLEKFVTPDYVEHTVATPSTRAATPRPFLGRAVDSASGGWAGPAYSGVLVMSCPFFGVVGKGFCPDGFALAPGLAFPRARRALRAGHR